MVITAHHREINLEIIGNCTKAIDQLEWEVESHMQIVARLQARIDDCKAKISQLTAELES